MGKCGVIKNTDLSLKNIYEGQCAQIAVEPIEKRPFFHILPGSNFLSVGFQGCSLNCDYCQNYRISQQTVKATKFHSPSDLVQLALNKKVAGIAFTYNEPTLYHNYIEEVGHYIGRHAYPLKLVIKTSGFVEKPIIRTLCLYADGINVDIKGDNDDYKKICGGWLDPVLDCIELVLDMETHLEISYLVLPERLHDMRYNIYLRNWLADIDPEIPFHILYFYPFHRMTGVSYKPSELMQLFELFSEKLAYVYVSNHFSPELATLRNTRCYWCENTLVSRQGHTKLNSSVCCNFPLPGIF